VVSVKYFVFEDDELIGGWNFRKVFSWLSRGTKWGNCDGKHI